MSRAAGPSGWALGGVITGHVLVGFVWLVVFLGTVFLTSSETGAADLVLLLGSFCWLVALPIIVITWQSGAHWYWGVPVAWVMVFGIAAAVAVSAGVKSFELRPVGVTATFDESADCLVRYGKNVVGLGGWRLVNDNVADCFPTQTAAKKKALIACFNKYEQSHPDHEGWPKENMRGCTWAGLTAVPARHVVTISFGKVVAVPAEPRAGKRFALAVSVTRKDSNAKTGQPAIEKEPMLEVDVTPLPDMTLKYPDPGSFQYGWFLDDDKLHVIFTVPKTAAGKRLTIKMTVTADTPPATKIVTFAVGK